MITLITGLPGNGKTLYALTWLKEKAEKEGRQVYFSGITDCKVPGWVEGDAEKWMDLPPGSIIIVDEVQRIMRPRQHGTTVPPFVAALETHRHKGVDLVLITQHPMLLDSNVRRLVGQHFHCVRKFGTHWSTVHEWMACKENCDKNREDSIKHEWRFPKESFALYRSAEVHTHKARIPKKVLVLLALPFVIGGLAYYTWFHRLSPDVKKGPVKNAFTGESLAATGTVTGASSAAGAKLTKTQYVEQYVPRVEGLLYTAPVYDDVTKPIVAPYPAACVASGSRCQCYTTQGTRIATTPDLCHSIVEGGFFVSWQQPLVQAVPMQPRSEPAGASYSVQGGVSSLGGSHVRLGSAIPSPSILAPESTEALPPGRGRNLPKPST